MGGEGETQDDASEEERQTAVDDGEGSDSNSEGEGELSEGESECEGVRVSRDCVRPSRNNKSSVVSIDCCRTYSSYLLQLQHAFISRICVSRKIVLLP